MAADDRAATAAAAVYNHDHHQQERLLSSANQELDVNRNKLIPRLDRPGSGRLGKLEPFSHYVARQMGFEDPKECQTLCRMANDYLKKTDGCESAIFAFFADDPQAEILYIQLIEEFERCILTYFAFHWSYSSRMITQVLGGADSERKNNFKDIVLAATRMQRFDRVIKDLKVTRVFSTLVEEIKAIGGIPSPNGNGSGGRSGGGGGGSKCTEVMAPVDHNNRSPVLLLMGGGMGAGKSTVLRDILKEPFWSGVADNMVVVEADAFKETDVIYRALSANGHHGDMLPTAELVHKSSTDAASSLLVTALNEGRDVIMDGTLSWIPFVQQTINMARNVHRKRYRMGEGYKVLEDNTVSEKYWEELNEDDEDDTNWKKSSTVDCNKPYRIELVGVVCDAYLAVVRGMRRAIMVGRAVRVKSQLNSHKNFATAFSTYCDLVDNARLYCTNTVCGPPRLIGWKDGPNNLLVDPDQIQIMAYLKELNIEAESIYDLYPNKENEVEVLYRQGSTWKEIVMLPNRSTIQVQLKTALIEYQQQHNYTTTHPAAGLM